MKRTELMEQVLQYIIEHLADELDIKEVAEHFDYSPVYFAKIFIEHFEIPFNRFVKMLRLRYVATELRTGRKIKGTREKWGTYSNSMSFSKAFRKEFGIGPREFAQSKKSVPDMPARERINGQPIRIEYITTNLFFVDAFHIEPLEEEINLMYAVGQMAGATEEQPEGTVRFGMPSGRYVLFSMERKADSMEMMESIIKLTRFIVHEWRYMNQREIDYGRMAFECYEEDRVTIYVPI